MITYRRDEIENKHGQYIAYYKYDWLHGKFRQQPRIESETKYYIVYKDGGIEETTKEKGMFYEKGDTIKSYSFVYKK